MPVFGDEIGMIWEEQVIESSRRGGKKEEWNPNASPKSGYKPPSGYRSFLSCERIGLDIETFDPNLFLKGSGVHRGDGKIVGVAIAYSNTDATYYPTAHTNTDRCVPNPDKFYSQLRADAAIYKGEVVGANLTYDLDWLCKEQNITFPNAQMRDVQIAEPLLNENKRSYKLDLLAREYLGEGKVKDELLEIYGKDYIKHMDMVDPGYAAAYGEGDTTIPLAILDKQEPVLRAQGLDNLFGIESRLMPLLVQMRQCGVRVDINRAEEALDWMKRSSKEAGDAITHESGVHVDVWSSDSVARAFESKGLPYLRTTKGNPSFKKGWLENHPSKLAKLIIAQREYDKIGGTFINNYILEGHVDGRLHCNFNQLRSDNYGTVSGRLSSSNPNLQNIPVRHPVMGPLLRSLFIPEEDHLWGSADWSQIEYRFLVHYAHIAPGIDASRAVGMYRNDITTDFHALAAEITGVDRKKAKNINFGVVYGMGVRTLASYIDCSFSEAEDMLATFHSEMPFLKSIFDMATTRATQVGCIKTILGRRRRFEQWEYGQNYKNSQLYSSKEEALVAKLANPSRNNVKRAHTHKALNALLQGSAADLMKKAMVEMYEAGIFNVLVPHITVHDEMNVSIPNTAIGMEAFKEMSHIMETSIKLEVPVFAASNIGENWSEAK